MTSFLTNKLKSNPFPSSLRVKVSVMKSDQGKGEEGGGGGGETGEEKEEEEEVEGGGETGKEEEEEEGN